MRHVRDRRWPALCCSVSAWLLAATSPVSAEWFADLYGGTTYTSRSDVTLIVNNPASSPADHTFHDVTWDPSATHGGRAGYWFEKVPWFGIGLDAFHFRADIPKQMVPLTVRGTQVIATLQAIDFSMTAIAFDIVRLRLPFVTSEEFPNGQLQPYATIGPALFMTRARNTVNGEFPTNQSVTDTSVGVKVGAGASWQFTKQVGVFGEYRFTHFRAEPVFNSSSSATLIPLQSDINTHHLLGGVSFRF